MIKNKNNNLATDINILSSFDFKRFLQDENSIKIGSTRINIFNYEFILIPICYVNHWSLVNIHIKEKKVRFFDSCISLKTDERNKLIKRFVSKLIEHDATKKDFSIDLTKWGFRKESKLPQQTNEYDCGLFICLYAKLISYNYKIDPSLFLVDYTKNFRDRMIEEIKNCELLGFDYNFAAQFNTKIKKH
jgi:Ulp1 family protease